MRNKRYDFSRVVAKANAQLEGFASRQGLDAGMPVAPGEIRATIAKALALKSERDNTLRHAQVLTGLMHEALFELSRRLELNIVAAEIKYDLESNEVEALGAKMRLKASRPKSEPTKATPSPAAGGGAGASKTGAEPQVA